jgi:septal ring factor EnvC (AmiA/AmiB activator)
VDSNAQLLEAVQQAETESEQMRATQAALQGELVNARGAVAERENTKSAADEQLSMFRQQSEEYTQLSRTLRDELAQAKAAQVAAEQSAAAAASLRTAADVGNAQLQRQVRIVGCTENPRRCVYGFPNAKSCW